MALHYLIDGYNLLFAFRDIPVGSWQEKREHLLRFLREKRPQGRNPATVVFDNRTGPGEESRTDDLTIIFTSGESADERIGELVRRAAHPRAWVVVSNDRGIQILVKGTGARFLTATDFLHKRSRSNPFSTTTEKPASEDGITDELRKRWL